MQDWSPLRVAKHPPPPLPPPYPITSDLVGCLIAPEVKNSNYCLHGVRGSLATRRVEKELGSGGYGKSYVLFFTIILSI